MTSSWAPRGEASCAPSIDAAEIGEVLGGTTMDALERWASGRSEATLEHLLDLRIRLVLDGLRT